MSDEKWVLQVCHGYDAPFMDCARQYASLFAGTGVKVCTVYLTGAPCETVRNGSASDEVVFMALSSRQLRGLKLKAIVALHRLTRQRRYRLCIAHRFKPVFVALLATRLPVIAVAHAFDVYAKPARQWLVRAFARRLLLVGVSRAIRDNLASDLAFLPGAQVVTLYNRCDPQALVAGHLGRDEARQQLQIPANALVIATVGRLHPKKSPGTLLQAFARVRQQLPAEALLVMVGSGELEQSLRRQAAELGVSGQLLLTGQVADAWRYFRAFDLFVLATRKEPFGMVLLEAMAAGVPVVSTDCGGAREVVEGCGRLFRHADTGALADILLEQTARLPFPAQQASLMLERLQRQFSDAAVRSQFWQLDFVRQALES